MVIASEMIVLHSGDEQLFSCMTIMTPDIIDSPSVVYNSMQRQILKSKESMPVILSWIYCYSHSLESIKMH